MKIWAKTIRDEKISRDLIYEYQHIDSLDDFIFAMQEICGQMDIPTPVCTRVNFTHFAMFNNTRFKERDFVESINFDILDIEAVPEKQNKK